MKQKTVYIIDAGTVKEVAYRDLVLDHAREALVTAPVGCVPNLHLREEVWFQVGDTELDTPSAAEREAEANEENGVRPEIVPVKRWSVWEWGFAGHFPRRLTVSDSPEMAQVAFENEAEMAFLNDFGSDRPILFESREEAEKYLKELEEGL